MTSMESGHARAASLKHAARRNHFVARIEKYEAKLKQEQKARAMLRENSAAVALSEPRSVATEQQQPSVAEKIVRLEQIQVQPEHKTFRQHEREDSPEQKTISEQKEIAVEPTPTLRELQRTASSGLKAVIRSTEVLNISNPAPAGKVPFLETKCSGNETNLYMKVSPSGLIEVDVAAIAAALKIRIKAADMAASMQEHAFRCAKDSLDALDKHHCKRIAYTLKKEFDKVYGPAWHCIVGTSFGSYVTHSLGGFVYFSLDKISVLLFKTAVEPVEHS